MNVVHIACNEGLSAVYPSQVLRPMSLVRQLTGARVRLVAGSPIGEFLRRPSRTAWRARRAMAEHQFGLSVMRLPTAPARLRGLAVERLLATGLLRHLIPAAEPVILHCRGRAATELGLALRSTHGRARVIFDCRGWEGPELLQAHGFASEEGAPGHLLAAARRLDAGQIAAALAGDAVIVVSNAMREVAVRQWGVDDGRLMVAPCCADVDDRCMAMRETTRARLGLEGRFVVVYCGSLAPYQAIDASLELFEAVRERRRDALFFGITPSPAAMSAILRRRGLPERDCRVVSVPHTQVAAHLAVADLALLVRDRCKVNAVASPVKFAEYLAAGVPVVVSEGIGDFSDLVRRAHVGCVVPGPRLTPDGAAVLRDFLDALANSGDAVRARCRALAERELSAARAAQALSGLYRRLWHDLAVAEADPRSAVQAHRAAA